MKRWKTRRTSFMESGTSTGLKEMSASEWSAMLRLTLASSIQVRKHSMTYSSSVESTRARLPKSKETLHTQRCRKRRLKKLISIWSERPTTGCSLKKKVTRKWLMLLVRRRSHLLRLSRSLRRASIWNEAASLFASSKISSIRRVAELKCQEMTCQIRWTKTFRVQVADWLLFSLSAH